MLGLSQERVPPKVRTVLAARKVIVLLNGYIHVSMYVLDVCLPLPPRRSSAAGDDSSPSNR